MFRPRRLLWLGILVGAVYLIWRWRQQQPAAGLPAYTPSAPTLPGAAPTGPAAGGAATQDAVKRRIPTRVHRGAPPALPTPPTPATATSATQPAAPGGEVSSSAGLRFAAEPELLAGAGPTDPGGDATAPADAATDAAPGPADASPLDVPSSPSDPISAATAAGPLNINSADLDALVALPGIGPSLARRIIAYRERNGPFRGVDQLIDIPGIGPNNIGEFRHLVTV